MQGMVNFFGPQRFGHELSCTPRVGLALLRLEYADAAAAILAPLFGDESSARRAFEEPGSLREKVQEKLEISTSLGWEERRLATAVARFGGEDILRCLRTLPSSLRRLYPASVQSVVFNALAAARVGDDGSGALALKEGDLVLLEPESMSPVDAWQATQWNVHDLKPHRLSSAEAGLVSPADGASSIFRMDHVVLPILGTSSELPGWLDEALQSPQCRAAGVTQGVVDLLRNARRGPPEVRLRGNYRHLLVLPRQCTVGLGASAAHPATWAGSEEEGDFGARIHQNAGAERQMPDAAVPVEVSFDLPAAAYATELAALLCLNAPTEKAPTLRGL